MEPESKSYTASGLLKTGNALDPDANVWNTHFHAEGLERRTELSVFTAIGYKLYGHVAYAELAAAGSDRRCERGCQQALIGCRYRQIREGCPSRPNIGAGAEYGRAVAGLEGSRTDGLAVTKNCLVRAQTDHHELGRFIPLLAVGFFRITIHFQPPLGMNTLTFQCLRGPDFISRSSSCGLCAVFVRWSMISATAAASGHARIVQNRQDLLRPHPTFDIDLLALDSVRRFH